MWTGWEGGKTGNTYTYTYATTGGHAALNRVDSGHFPNGWPDRW